MSELKALRNHIRHIPLTIYTTGLDYVDIPDGSKILTAVLMKGVVNLCVEIHPAGTIRQRKIWFRKDGDISEKGTYLMTFPVTIHPDGSYEHIHVFIED